MVCPVPRERDAGSVNFLPILFFCAQPRRNMVSYAQTIQESLRSTHRLALLEPEKFVSEPNEVENAPQRAHLFRASDRAFSGPQQEHGRRLRPLSFPVNGTGARRSGLVLRGTTAAGKRDRAGKTCSVRRWRDASRRRLAPSIRLRNQPKGIRKQKWA